MPNSRPYLRYAWMGPKECGPICTNPKECGPKRVRNEVSADTKECRSKSARTQKSTDPKECGSQRAERDWYGSKRMRT